MVNAVWNLASGAPRRETGLACDAVIGSGPAGMTCAYFLALLGHEITVFETSPILGGIPRIGIPEYRLPKDVVDKEINQVTELGIDIRTNTRVGKDLSFQDITEEYDACFIAVGGHGAMELKIPGEDSQGVISGLEFLKDVVLGREPSLGSRVVVIGGGNVAIDAARTAKRIKAGRKKVAVIERDMIPGQGGIFCQEIKWALSAEHQLVPVYGFVSGLGGRDITASLIEKAILFTLQEELPEQDVIWLGLEEKKMGDEYDKGSIKIY